MGACFGGPLDGSFLRRSLSDCALRSFGQHYYRERRARRESTPVAPSRGRHARSASEPTAVPRVAPEAKVGGSGGFRRTTNGGNNGFVGLLGRQKLGLELYREVNGKGGTHRKVHNILSAWEIRGARRPITDFYSMEQHLCEGYYGTVQRWSLRAPWAKEERHVAVKQIRWKKVWHGWWREKEQEQLIRNELKTLLVLDHPFIIKFREWFEHPCFGIFFVMELCYGPSLQGVLESVCSLGTTERTAQMPRLKRLFREVTYAVSYLHSSGVAHGDLKPDNVLLKSCDAGSCAKLIDFGLASLRDRDGLDEGCPRGTPVFMPPEAYLNVRVDSKLAEAADIWALGVMLTWVVTAVAQGELLHPMLELEEGSGFDVRFIDLYHAYRERRPVQREHFAGQPDAALRVAARTLAHEPAMRAPVAEVLREEWLQADDPCGTECMELLRARGVIKNISSYNHLSHFEKAVLSLVADAATDTQVKRLRQSFRALDVQRNGRLSREELHAGLRRSGVEFSEDTIEAFFDEMVRDGSGLINYNEWLAATLGSETLRCEKAVGAAFQCLDVSCTGALTYEDLVPFVGDEAAFNTVQIFWERNGRATVSYSDFRSMVEDLASKRAPLAGDSPSI